MNTQATSLFDLIERWSVEVSVIPSYVNSKRGAKLTTQERMALLVRRSTIKRLILELRRTMANMTVTYRGIRDGVVVVEASTEEECWAVMNGSGVVEFSLSTEWLQTEASILHINPEKGRPE